MKNTKVFLLVLLFCHAVVHGQKIQYSRQTIESPFADATQLVADISGNHHLLYFTAGKKPKLFIFNKQLQVVGEKELEQKLNRHSEIRIIPFKNYYYLYTHIPETDKRTIIKIDSEGEEQDLSGALLKLMDSADIDKLSSLQFVNHHNRLFLLSHSYFAALEKISTTIAEASAELEAKNINQVVFAFDGRSENFQQTVLTDEHLIVSKSHRDSAGGSVLEIVKFNLKSGEVFSNYFSSPNHWYINPTLQYSEADSTLLVYSLLREPIGSARTQRTVFIAKLNDSLQPTIPLGLLRNQFRNNAAFSYLLLGGAQPNWLFFSNNVPLRRVSNRSVGLNYYNDYGLGNIDMSRFRDTYLDYPVYYSQPTSVRLTVLDEKLKTTTDSLVTNDRSYYDLQPRPSAQFKIDGKSYLVLIQNFSTNKRGLVMLHANKNGTLDTTPLPVYDRYEYNLTTLQASGDYFILPYSRKRETGLLKISLTN